MEITKDEYENAKLIVEIYEEQEYEKIESSLPIIKKRLEEYFKDTMIEEFYLSIDRNSMNTSIDIISEVPEFDEDYNGCFDKDMKKFSKEFGINIYFESGNYSK